MRRARLSAAPNGFIKRIYIYSCGEAVRALSRSCRLNNGPFKQREQCRVKALLNRFGNAFG